MFMIAMTFSYVGGGVIERSTTIHQ